MNKNRPRNLLSMVTVSIIVIMLVIVLQVSSSRLEDKKASYEQEEQYYIEKIAKENKRTENIEEYKRYTQTKQFVEDVARKRFGLVYKDEIILEAEN